MKVGLAGIVLLAFSFASQAAITVKDPYARATPPNAPNSAAFMVIENSGPTTLSLVEASTPAAGVVELHTHTKHDGMMKMRQVEEIDVPHNGEVVLQPGGLHVMLFELTTPLVEGESIPLTLIFSDGSEIQKNVPIRKVMGGSKVKHSTKHNH